MLHYLKYQNNVFHLIHAVYLLLKFDMICVDNTFWEALLSKKERVFYNRIFNGPFLDFIRQTERELFQALLI